LAHIHYKKFASGEHIVRPPNVVYITALPCKSSNKTTIVFVHSLSMYEHNGKVVIVLRPTTVNNNKYEKNLYFTTEV